MKKIGLILSILVVALCASCSKKNSGDYTTASHFEIISTVLTPEQIKIIEEQIDGKIPKTTMYFDEEKDAIKVYDTFCNKVFDGMKKFGASKLLTGDDAVIIYVTLHYGSTADGALVKSTAFVGTKDGWSMK